MKRHPMRTKPRAPRRASKPAHLPGGFAEPPGLRDEAIATLAAAFRQNPSEEIAEQLALAWTDKGHALSRLGRPAEALEAHRAAAKVCRRLVLDSVCARPALRLAQALLNMSGHLTALHRTDEALRCAEESCAWYGRLIHEAGAHRLRNEMATAVMNCGLALMNAGRREEAKRALDDAVSIFDQLVHTEARLECTADLALAHFNAAECAMNLGRPDEALTSYEKAAALYLCLDRRAFAADRAITAVNLADALRELGRPDDALASVRRGLAGLRRLVERDGYEGLASELASAHNGHGLILMDLKRLRQSLAAFDTAIRLLAQLTRDVRYPELDSKLTFVRSNRALAQERLEQQSEAKVLASSL